MFDGFEGFCREEFLFEDRPAVIVFPREKKPGAVPLLKCEYWNAFPALEEEMLRRGHALLFIRNDDRWARPEELSRKARFLRFAAEKYGLPVRSIPVGMSCGGQIAVKFASDFPELVSVLYLDAPVMNYISCPLGAGIGEELPSGVKEFLDAHGVTLSELISFRDMPMDRIGDLIRDRIPLALVAGDSDRTVPFAENGIWLEKAYEAAGVPFWFELKKGCDHHPHGPTEPGKLADFLEEFDGGEGNA